MTGAADADLDAAAAAAAAGAAELTLRAHGHDWWRHWNGDAIDATCARVANADLRAFPEVAFWRALAAFMGERDDALACLQLAFDGYAAASDRPRMERTAHLAVTLCLLDTGTMDAVTVWLERADGLASDFPVVPTPDRFDFDCAGRIARQVLGGKPVPGADESARWLESQLRPLQETLLPDERLIAAQILVNYHFSRQEYAPFDLLASIVEHEPAFSLASPLMRARWLYILGYARYQIGGHAAAERDWMRALRIGQSEALAGTSLQASLALVRLCVDRSRTAEAQALLDAVEPQWGAGRLMQLLVLQQMRARVSLVTGHPVQALGRLDEALALADVAALSASERASCLTDRIQILVALGRSDEAATLAERLAAEHAGRDAGVYRVLGALLQARSTQDAEPGLCEAALRRGLVAAQELRYTMFFRLLPEVAAGLCGLALRVGIETAFVTEVIRLRSLPAPPEADTAWPWPLWVRLIGRFEFSRDGAACPLSGKLQQKPLELLRLLCSSRQLTIGVPDAIEALWPGGVEGAPKKNLEMTVQRLRRLLGDDSLVQFADGRVTCDPARVSSDVLQRRARVDRIEALAMRPPGRFEDEPRRAAECGRLIAPILAVSEGEFLPGVTGVAWVEAQRSLIRRETVRAAVAAANITRRFGTTGGERALLQAALRIEPLAEELALCLMRAYGRAGQRADALQVHDRLRTDLAALGVVPGRAVDELWRALVRGEELGL